MNTNRAPSRMMTIFTPKKKDGRWVTTAVVYTPLGQVNIEAHGSEDLARLAVQRVQTMLAPTGDNVAGVFDDMRAAVVKVAKSKGFTQVFNQARSVLKNPLLRSLAGKVPFVSSVLTAADASFAIVDGIRAGQVDAKSILQNALSLASSADPTIAAKGKKLLDGLKVAQVASSLFDSVQKRDPAAKAKVRELRNKAREGDLQAAAAFTAYREARRYRIRDLAAQTVKAALSGDIGAQTQIDKIYQNAKEGDRHAREAVRAMKKIILRTEGPKVGGISDDLTLYEKEALSVGGNPPYYALMQAIHDLKSRFVH